MKHGYFIGLFVLALIVAFASTAEAQVCLRGGCQKQKEKHWDVVKSHGHGGAGLGVQASAQMVVPVELAEVRVRRGFHPFRGLGCHKRAALVNAETYASGQGYASPQGPVTMPPPPGKTLPTPQAPGKAMPPVTGKALPTLQAPGK